MTSRRISATVSRMRRLPISLLLASPALLGACGSPPAEAPPPPRIERPAASAPAPEVPVGARVAERLGSRESTPHARLRVVFENPSARPCTFTGYVVRWGDRWKKTPNLDPFTIPPGETRDRMLRVDPGDSGYEDLTKADLAAVTVEVKSDCPVRKPDR